jgi:hypothetical protein
MIVHFGNLLLIIGCSYVLHLYFYRLVKIEKRIETIEAKLDNLRDSYNETVKNLFKDGDN